MSYLKLDGISKLFGDFKALDDVSIDIEKASIRAILGENGAGKTTLMNILYGLYQPDGGQLTLNDKPLTINSPSHAIEQGIGMIHQHFMLVDSLTVAENVVLGLDGMGPSLKLAEHAEKLAKLSQEVGFEIDPMTEIWKLPMGMRQRVEILKVLYRNADILILDEPTSVLAPDEIGTFLETLDQLRAAGKTIIFITHKLEEVFEVGDHISVMRHGKIVGHRATKETDATEMARMMVGRDVLLDISKPEAKFGAIALEVKNLVAHNERGLVALRDVSFSLKQGEVLGIAGVDGNGQAELAEVITGLRALGSGSIEVKGEDISNRSVSERRHQLKMGFVPEDRHATGLVLDFSIVRNAMLRDYQQSPFSENGLVRESAVEKIAGQWVVDYDVRFQSLQQSVRFLSGGNQQKLIFAREVECVPEILVVMQPCKGLDIGAIEAVQQTIIEQRSRGVAILYISTELEHILAVADRVGVMCAGELTGIINSEQASSERIGLLMAGIRETEAAAC